VPLAVIVLSTAERLLASRLRVHLAAWTVVTLNDVKTPANRRTATIDISILLFIQFSLGERVERIE